MKRDDEMIRALLLEAEASDHPYLMSMLTISPSEMDIKRHTHVHLLCDAGFFQKVGEGTFRITNQGHDFLAAIRDDTIWKKTKAAASAAGGLSLNIMLDIALGYLKQKVSTYLG